MVTGCHPDGMDVGHVYGTSLKGFWVPMVTGNPGTNAASSCRMQPPRAGCPQTRKLHVSSVTKKGCLHLSC